MKKFSGYILRGLPYMILFIGLFVWFAFFADYVLFFQEKASLFLLSGDYLSEKLLQPGGALYCISGFLTSFYYYPVAGAIVISGIITLTTLVISRTIFILSGRNEKIYPFVTGLLLFLLHTDYTVFLKTSMGVLIQVTAFFIFIKTAKKLNGWLFLVLAPLLYIISGGFSWLFMILVSLYLVVFERRLLPARIMSLWIMMFLFFIIARKYIFFTSDTDLLFFPVELPVESFSRMIFFAVSASSVLLPGISVIKLPVPNFISATYNSESVIRSMVVLAFIMLIGVYRYDRKNDHYFHAEKLFYQEKYDELIDYNTKNPSSNVLTLFFNNIALAERGMLNDRLFGFLQSSEGKTLFLKWEMMKEILKRGGYFYYSIGMINEAHRWAYENMVMTGHTPEGLKMLIKTELINGNYAMAAKYISLLKKTLFYKKDAAHFAKFLFNDDAVNSDSELGRKRKTRIRTDFFSITDDPYVNIERINISDSLNLAAFNYKIAWLLLRKDYKGFLDNLPRFENLGYKQFPVHVEEALIAISTMNNGENSYHGNIRISRYTEERWTQFLTMFQQYGNDARAAEPALRKQFGNTFWYWAFYR